MEEVGSGIVIFFLLLGEGGEGVDEGIWKWERRVDEEGIDGLDELL